MTSPSTATCVIAAPIVRHGVKTFEQSLVSEPVTATKTRAASGHGGVVNVRSAPSVDPTELLARARKWYSMSHVRPLTAALCGTALVPEPREAPLVVEPYASVVP